MILRRLKLINFRCYSSATFEFCPGINTICGANARGKTTILEAIYFLISGTSFRAQQAADLIAMGASSFYIEADFIKHGVEQKLRIGCNGKERKILHNNTALASTSSLIGLLQGVVMTPDDVAIIKGAPAVRRQFLDLQIAQSDPLYVHHLTRYHKAMRQRNALLKSKNCSSLYTWEHEMANSAAYISKQRHQASIDLEGTGSELHSKISGHSEKLSLQYKTSAPILESTTQLKGHFEAQFNRLRQKELLFGVTLAGPHKDDLGITIGQKEARFFASEGQQRSCVAALHMAEWTRLNAIGDEPPLMLIDDVGISLDASRRNNLLTHACQMGQVFLTSTHELPIPSQNKETKVIHIEN